MCRVLILLGLGFLLVVPAHGQDRKLLKSKGWGSLSGKVIHGRTGRPIANALVFLKAPGGTYFPIHNNDRVRKKPLVIDVTKAAFTPRLSAHFPSYFDGKKMASTGEKITFRNDSKFAINLRATPHPILNEDNSFNLILSAKTSATKTFNAQPMPVVLQDDLAPAKKKGLVQVFDHPYFGITDKNGSFNIPRVPANADIAVIGWHEDFGWIPQKAGTRLKFKAGKNALDLIWPR
ncbi:MAG: hypothetical protein HYX68_09590 [Planctomycetes bacterium]|nr:hypothetical protein [Planctomycetota bacterium]